MTLEADGINPLFFDDDEDDYDTITIDGGFQYKAGPYTT